MYVDGHEQEDAVAYRTWFLERMRNETFMPKFVGPGMELKIWLAVYSIILVTHDDSTISVGMPVDVLSAGNVTARFL